MVIFFEGIPFFLRTISANWRDINQAGSVLDEGSSFDWNVNVCYKVQAEVDELFKIDFTQIIFDALS